ncbi:hypothetical protein HQ585_10090 [candidate division KSB1 bacterium]|nr:hypothetical protein [candidate division KSB1 bacterium]
MIVSTYSHTPNVSSESLLMYRVRKISWNVARTTAITPAMHIHLLLSILIQNISLNWMAIYRRQGKVNPTGKTRNVYYAVLRCCKRIVIIVIIVKLKAWTDITDVTDVTDVSDVL